jgi:hypothetical protein
MQGHRIPQSKHLTHVYALLTYDDDCFACCHLATTSCSLRSYIFFHTYKATASISHLPFPYFDFSTSSSHIRPSGHELITTRSSKEAHLISSTLNSHQCQTDKLATCRLSAQLQTYERVSPVSSAVNTQRYIWNCRINHGTEHSRFTPVSQQSFIGCTGLRLLGICEIKYRINYIMTHAHPLL